MHVLKKKFYTYMKANMAWTV